MSFSAFVWESWTSDCSTSDLNSLVWNAVCWCHLHVVCYWLRLPTEVAVASSPHQTNLNTTSMNTEYECDNPTICCSMSDQSRAWYLRICQKKGGSPKYRKINKITTNFHYNLSFQSKQGSVVDTRNLHKTLVHSGALWLVTIYTEIVSIKLYFGIIVFWQILQYRGFGCNRHRFFESSNIKEMSHSWLVFMVE